MLTVKKKQTGRQEMKRSISELCITPDYLQLFITDSIVLLESLFNDICKLRECQVHALLTFQLHLKMNLSYFLIQPLGRGWRGEELIEYGGRCDIRTSGHSEGMNTTNEDV